MSQPLEAAFCPCCHICLGCALTMPTNPKAGKNVIYIKQRRGHYWRCNRCKSVDVQNFDMSTLELQEIGDGED